MPFAAARAGGGLRPAVNRLLAVLAIVVVTPLVAVAELVARGSGGRIVRATALALAGLAGVRIDVIGRERLEPGCAYVFAPNHESPLDIPALFVAHPGVRFAAAVELFRKPFLRVAMRALGTVPIDRERPEVARRALAKAAKRLGPGACLVIFPEGGFAPPGVLLPFKSGAFVFAIQLRVPVVPVALHNTSAVMPPKGKLAIVPGRVVVEILEPVPTEGLGNEDRHALRDRVRGALLAALRPENGGVAARPDLGPFDKPPRRGGGW